MSTQPILTVSELNGSIRKLLEKRFPFIVVQGEISNLRRPYSGHCYFTLKDDRAQIKAVLFKMQQRYLQQELKDGQHVVCKGRISVYEPRGDYQLIVDGVDFQGAGSLHKQFELLKQKLASEGLFDEHLKKPFPLFPRHLTLITSPQGAAVHDFIRIARKRFPLTRLAVYPVSVQGDQAAGEICAAIENLNRLQITDALVLCRGGGSLEDLWCFNDASLARTIFNSQLPVVSAVGHEIDFTIADFVADLRAPTPSGAAEMLLPDQDTIKENIAQSSVKLCHSINRVLEKNTDRVQFCRHRLGDTPHPLDNLLLKLDQMGLTLELQLKNILHQKETRLASFSERLQRQNPQSTLQQHQHRLDDLFGRLKRITSQQVSDRQAKLAQLAGVLDAVSPLATLSRGYSIVRKQTGVKGIISRASQIKTGERVDITLHQGSMACRVEEVQPSQPEMEETATPQ